MEVAAFLGETTRGSSGLLGMPRGNKIKQGFEKKGANGGIWRPGLQLVGAVMALQQPACRLDR